MSANPSMIDQWLFHYSHGRARRGDGTMTDQFCRAKIWQESDPQCPHYCSHRHTNKNTALKCAQTMLRKVRSSELIF